MSSLSNDYFMASTGSIGRLSLPYVERGFASNLVFHFGVLILQIQRDAAKGGQRRWYHMVWYNTYSHSVQTTGDPLDPEVFLCMYLVLEDGPPTLSLS